MLGRFFVVEAVEPPDAPPELEPSLTHAVERARSGLRRDVALLLDALDGEELLVPISKTPPDVPDGEEVELKDELTLSPHLLPDSEGDPFVALFTHMEPLDPIVSALGWTTDGGDLKVCGLPARLGLEMALKVLDDQRVRGLVIDPGAPSELGLTRNELASLLAGRPIPLVAYVEHIPRDDSERTLVAESGEPFPPDLIAALEGWVNGVDAVTGYKLERTFNPDRDLEPHLTLTLQVNAEADRHDLFKGVTQAISGQLPPPGYLDVLFET
jgi:hypothetical protein